MPEPLAIEVPSKEPITVKVTRMGMRTVSGRVVDTRHHPLAGVTVTFQIVEGDRPARSHQMTAVTGADGGYQLAKIPAGVEVDLLSLEKAGYRQCLTGTLTNDGRDTIGDAVMAALHGHGAWEGVRDADGKPVPGATVVSRGRRAGRPHHHGCDGRLHAERPAGRRAAPGRRHPDRRRAGHRATGSQCGFRITCTPGARRRPDRYPAGAETARRR